MKKDLELEYNSFKYDTDRGEMLVIDVLNNDGKFSEYALNRHTGLKIILSQYVSSRDYNDIMIMAEKFEYESGDKDYFDKHG
jgi:hypothetical protein